MHSACCYMSSSHAQCCYYLLQHQAARIIDIDFSRPIRDRDFKLDSSPQPHPQKRPIELPTNDEQSAFLEGVKKICPKSAILSAVFQQEQSQPATTHIQLPRTIPSLHHPKYKDMTEPELSAECEHIFKEMVVSQQEADYLARSTTLQAESLLWYEHRLGRLTASRFSSVCHTSISSPSQSLITSILSHQTVKSAAIQWGRDNEARACNNYESTVKL